MCDIEFTIEDGQLWLLQVRVGKRSPSAAFRIAVDLVDEGRIDLDEALRRVDGTQLQSLLHPQFAATDGAEVVGRGLAASPGAAVGEVVLDAATATAWAGTGREVILVRPETSADDVAGMIAAAAVVTARGGLTSHAAVVARGLGRTCVTGVVGLEVDVDKRSGTWPRRVQHPRGRPGLRGRDHGHAPSGTAHGPTQRCGGRAPRRTRRGGALLAGSCRRRPPPAARRPTAHPRRPGERRNRPRGESRADLRRRRHRALPDRAHAPRLPTRPGREPRHRRPPQSRSRRDRLGDPDRADVGPTSHGRRPGCGPTSRPAAARVPARPDRADRVRRRRGCSRPTRRRCPLPSSACAAVA